jgi:hypothetical protein
MEDHKPDFEGKHQDDDDHHHYHAKMPVREHDFADERPGDALGGSKFVHRGHPKPIDIGITRTGSVRGKYPFGN